GGRPPSIHIFYYPWYGNPEFDQKYIHWNHAYLKNWDKSDKAKYPEGNHKPPEDIGSVYYPQLGPYSSKNPAVIDKHMKWISSAGIDVVVVSWYPEGLADDNGDDWGPIIPLLLNATEKYKMKMTLHLEPYAKQTAETVRRDIEYIVDKYGSHPAFYRTSRKNATKGQKELPLLYAYDSYRIPVDEWTKLTSPNGSLSIRNTTFDVLLIGLYVQMEDRFKLKKAGFDGLYTYFAADGFSHGSTMSNWPSLSAYCAKNDLLFIPSVGPGYDDTRVRPWNAKNTKERNGGNYYREHFEMAHSAKADIVSITSFNEWHEGTQIEPAIPFKDENGTEFVYKQYEKGAEQYLEITLEMIKAYFTPHHENIPMQIERII
uniref:Glycoprotein endo-alpha-1,2-mannosidase n=1 Tax=Acrobeloides nanus TaxID=290746 RepID=A0A914E9G6_9BILA